MLKKAAIKTEYLTLLFLPLLSLSLSLKMIKLRDALLMGVGLITVVLHACFLSVCVAKDQIYQKCRPSSCGDVGTILYPFRLQSDPPSCGYPEYELICENNRTIINLNGGKFSVTQINYHDHTIRVVDPEQKKGNCWISSPLQSSVYDNQYGPYSLPYYPSPPSQLTFYTIFSMKCEQEVSDDNYIPIIPCNTTTTTTGYYSSSSSSSSSSPTYGYAVFGDYVRLGDIPYSCTIGTYMVIQPLKIISKPRNISMSDLQDYLLHGLQLSFLGYFCDRHCGMKGQFCRYEKWNAFQCYKSWQNPITNTSDKTCEYD